MALANTARKGIRSSSRLVLFVANDSDYFCAHWLQRAMAVRAAGYRVELAMPSGPSVEKLIRHGFVVHEIALIRQSTSVLSELRTFLTLIRLYRRQQPDLVHHLTIKPVLYGGFAARLARIPTVVSAITGLGYVFSSTGSSTGWQRAVLRAAVLVTYRFALGHPRMRVTFENCADRALLMKYHVINEANSIVIKGAGIDMQQYSPSPEPDGSPIVILPARLIWDKGVREFVEAARRLRTEGINARFALIGDTDLGNPARVPRHQLAAWQSEGVIEWWGRRTDMPHVYRGTHIVCLPTFYPEGIPRSLIEAAACTRPIVATDTPGCREVVADGVNGFLVPIRDVGALASALRKLINDPTLRKRMGECGRQMVVEDCSDVTVARRTLEVYEEILT